MLHFMNLLFFFIFFAFLYMLIRSERYFLLVLTHIVLLGLKIFSKGTTINQQVQIII